MILRDLTPFELKYLDRDTLAERVAKLQTQCASLRNQVERHAAELEQARTQPAGAAPSSVLERVRTDDGCYRVLREGVGAGSLTYDPVVEVLDASWLSSRDPRVGGSAAEIAAGILDQHGETALWEHLETLAQQLSEQQEMGARG
jgi:hypothetical protein